MSSAEVAQRVVKLKLMFLSLTVNKASHFIQVNPKKMSMFWEYGENMNEIPIIVFREKKNQPQENHQ